MGTEHVDLLDEEEENGEKPTHRLFGIRVGEISLVDRPANRCPFLIIKRSSSMDDNGKTETEIEITPDENGDLVTAEKDGVPPESAPTAEAPPAAEPPIPGGEEEKALSISAEVKDQVLRALAATMQKIMSLANAIKEAETATESTETPLPEAVSKDIAAIQEMLGAIVEQYSGSEEEQPPEGDAPPPPEGDDDGMGKSEDGAEGDPLEQMKQLIESFGGAASDEDVEKARARLSAKQIRDAFKSMEKLAIFMTEFKRVVEGAGLVDVMGKRDEQPDPPAEPEAEPTPDAENALVSTKDDLARISQGIQKLAQVIKRHQGEIDGLKSRPQPSNALAVDGQAPGQAGKDKFRWPAGDMNEHLGHDTVTGD